MQELSFAIITSLLFSNMPQVKQNLIDVSGAIVQAVKTYIETASYKSDKPSAENALECLVRLVEVSPPARQFTFETLVHTLTVYGRYMANNEDSLTKLHLIRTLQITLSTSDPKNALVLKNHDEAAGVSLLLTEICRTDDIYLIAHALDAFFDIFADNHYD